MIYGFQREVTERKRRIHLSGRLRERGNSLVENALVLTVLLTMLFAIIDFGRALYTYHFVSNAAREASRWASVRGSTCDPTLSGCPATRGAGGNVQALVANVSGMGLDPALVHTTTSFVAPPNTTPACAPPTNNPGCVVEVTVKYDYHFFFPFLPSSLVTMTSTSQMVITQ